MSVPPAWPQVLDFFGTPLVIEPSAGQLSGDAGLLPVRRFDGRLGLTRAFTDALDGPRAPASRSTPPWGWSGPAPTAPSLCGGSTGLLFATERLASK
jgi:hypothetical protein